MSDIERADIIILPGTKATLDDLYELRRNGVAKAIIRAHHDGKQVIGICGGYQMLGQTVNDPDGIEGSVASLPGLGLLNIDTTMTADKTTEQVEFSFEGQRCVGYEIHQGRSTWSREGKASSLPSVVREGTCMGTYIHGFLDNMAVLDYLLSPFADQASTDSQAVVQESVEEFRNRQYDLLADHLRQYVDIDKLYAILTSPSSPNYETTSSLNG